MSPRQPRIPRFAGRWRCGATALAAMALLFVVFAAPVSAHVEIDVGDGQYVMEIGFRDEPAFLGQPNAVFVHVERYATGGTEPVEGLAATLTAEVTKDGQTFTPPLVPDGEGSYEAVFVPTALGDYTFRIAGTIEDAPVDESVTSGPSTFNSVEPLSAIEFPATEADTATTQVQESLARAQSDAAMARTLAIVGIAAGLLGLIVAAVAFSRAGRAAPVAAPAPAAASEPSGKLIR